MTEVAAAANRHMWAQLEGQDTNPTKAALDALVAQDAARLYSGATTFCGVRLRSHVGHLQRMRTMITYADGLIFAPYL